MGENSINWTGNRDKIVEEKNNIRRRHFKCKNNKTSGKKNNCKLSPSSYVLLFVQLFTFTYKLFTSTIIKTKTRTRTCIGVRPLSLSTVIKGYILISLLIFSLSKVTLAVPTSTMNTYDDDDDIVSVRDDELDTIRTSIMEGLALNSIPDPSKANVSQIEFERAHEEYLSRLQMSRAPEDKKIKIYSFNHSDEIPMDILRRNKRHNIKYDNYKSLNKNYHTHSLYFPIKITDLYHSIENSVLRLLLKTSSDYPVNDGINIMIYRLNNYTKTSGKTQTTMIKRELLETKFIDKLDSPRWIELDTTETTIHWHQGLINNLGLELLIETIGPSKSKLFIYNPKLYIFTTSTTSIPQKLTNERMKRSAPEQLMSLHKGRRTECRGDNKRCCRHEMTVVFKDLKGFEFIVQPKTFDAGYCKGRCPPRYNPAHHHALLQSLIWKEDRRKAPRPCCAPSKLAELEILYFDENDPTKLKVSSWKNMRVLECACS